MKRKIKSISQLKKEADRIFSLWIRARDKQCVTCLSKDNLQCGHYISRSINILRYDERNCNAQCVRCNVFLKGNMPQYSYYMILKYGRGIIKKLLKEKQKLHQFKRAELEAIIEKYRL